MHQKTPFELEKTPDISSDRINAKKNNSRGLTKEIGRREDKNVSKCCVVFLSTYYPDGTEAVRVRFGTSKGGSITVKAGDGQ